MSGAICAIYAFVLQVTGKQQRTRETAGCMYNSDHHFASKAFGGFVHNREELPRTDHGAAGLSRPHCRKKMRQISPPCSLQTVLAWRYHRLRPSPGVR
jgi:hypothetical protein